MSRSSSASGKKKTKKQRNYDDDGFEARSRFPYYPQQYQMSSYNGEANGLYYGGYPAPIQNSHYPAMAPNVSPPPSFNPAYPVMMAQDQQAYGWPPPQYQPTNGSMGYSAYGPVSNGYDLSADFQRGMQSFQSAGMPTQATPKMTNPQIASYQEPYQPPSIPMNQGWPQMTPPQPSYPMNQPSYPQNSPNSRPLAPMQGPVPTPYGYGQFPISNYNTGKQNRNQHPLPGSFNRQQFNPQSQAFVPGGRNGGFPMQQNMGPVPPQGMNNYGNMAMPMGTQMQNSMARQNSSAPHNNTFGSPREHNNHPLPAQVNNPAASQPIQPASSQQGGGPPPTSQSSNSSVPAQSSIAKWGTPSHLPPKPPPPAQPQAPKFNIPGHGFPPVPRLPNGMAPAFPANVPVMRGGATNGIPTNKQ